MPNMPELNRKDFLQSLALGGSSLLAQTAIMPAANDELSSEIKTMTLKSDQFELILQAGKDAIACRLQHLPSGTLLADGPYSYSFGNPSFIVVSQDASLVTFKGATRTGLEIVHTFRVPAKSPWIEEEISIRNTTSHPVSETFRCGFTLPVRSGTLSDYIFTAVPFRRQTRDERHTYDDYSLDQILYQKRRGNLREDSLPPRVYENYFSEGWAATNGTTGFLFSKYNALAREWSILDRIPLEQGLTGLRWGGAGVDASDCEGFCVIPAGEAHSFGSSRLTYFPGDLTQGYYAFRAEMESRGHGLPAGFDPPIHWNELYDNKLWFLPDNGQDKPENRAKYYSLDDMKGEAAKAKAMCCEALYCDPGWDTNFGSKIWDDARLGKVSDFVATMKTDYGLKVSLHTPLSGWNNPISYAPECLRLDDKGRKMSTCCGASEQYVDETSRRLHVLAEGGVTFFMFDGTAYLGECWDPKHGHSVPSTCGEHIDATNRLARLVHKKYPHVAIEMHDQVAGGSHVRYVPLYYGHGVDASGVNGFDTVWAFELMSAPLRDIYNGLAMPLYYYNLAYSLPLYLHVDLREDNEQALMLWWYASTCRHLGFGGTHENPKVREAQLATMNTYRRIKPFYAAGVFYGIDEWTHVHRHPDQNSAVINCFNINEAVNKEIAFDPAAFGLDAARAYKFTGAEATLSGGTYRLKLALLAHGHSLIEVVEA